MHYVYILTCADGTLYTGVTVDLVRRIHAHNNSKAGAKYTRVRRPVALAYSEPCRTLSRALKREYAIKSLTRAEKMALIAKTCK